MVWGAMMPHLLLWRRSAGESTKTPNPWKSWLVIYPIQNFSWTETATNDPKKAVEGVLKDWYNRKRIALIHDENCEGLLFQPELSQKVIQGFEFLVPYYLYLYSVSADELLL